MSDRTSRSNGAVWVQLLDDVTLSSNADGTARTQVLTAWGLFRYRV
jgi:hypothetical protein